MITLVIGASLKEERYSNKAIKMLREYKHTVLAHGLREGLIEDVLVQKDWMDYEDIDTVTLYLNPSRQEEFYDAIIKLNPRRVIFNPGTENSEFVSLLSNNNIQSEEACTLVLLRTNQY
ncbi:CoA-binding protein [Myroides sp. M-43]|uniref:CoA-binding protein n=1 Tax=Myroides oncorhynchi TaxID=2893756 RepID=UPI001E54FB5F|nr:CoA-binding protein [Myroides oncorhynchi]MCC9042847.1 CoA-binding protein [Myroides oncorhynchi]